MVKMASNSLKCILNTPFETKKRVEIFTLFLETFTLFWKFSRIFGNFHTFLEIFTLFWNLFLTSLSTINTTKRLT